MRVTGTVDIPRFPRNRPHVKVEFFTPSGGGLQPGESAGQLSARLTAEIRASAPRLVAGRSRKKQRARAEAAAAAEPRD